jgi:hypothetical protein
MSSENLNTRLLDQSDFLIRIGSVVSSTPEKHSVNLAVQEHGDEEDIFA